MEDLTAEMRARRRARYFTGLLWHIGAFAIIITAFWVLDLAVGQDGLQWAPWIAAVWGFALAFHVLAYVVDGRGTEHRRAEKYLHHERRHLQH